MSWSSEHHIIRRLIVDITVPHDHGRVALESQVGDLLRERILPRFQKELDALITEHAEQMGVQRIDRLELDLGTIVRKAVELEFPTRSVKAFKSQLRKGLAKSTRTVEDPDQLALDALQYYLRLGRFPWWFTSVRFQSLDDVVYRLLVERRAPLVALVRKHLRSDPKAVRRLVDQLQLVSTSRLATAMLNHSRLPLTERITALSNLKVAKFKGGEALARHLLARVLLEASIDRSKTESAAFWSRLLMDATAAYTDCSLTELASALQKEEKYQRPDQVHWTEEALKFQPQGKEPEPKVKPAEIATSIPESAIQRGDKPRLLLLYLFEHGSLPAEATANETRDLWKNLLHAFHVSDRTIVRSFRAALKEESFPHWLKQAVSTLLWQADRSTSARLAARWKGDKENLLRGKITAWKQFFLIAGQSELPVQIAWKKQALDLPDVSASSLEKAWEKLQQFVQALPLVREKDDWPHLVWQKHWRAFVAEKAQHTAAWIALLSHWVESVDGHSTLAKLAPDWLQTILNATDDAGVTPIFVPSQQQMVREKVGVIKALLADVTPPFQGQEYGVDDDHLEDALQSFLRTGSWPAWTPLPDWKAALKLLQNRNVERASFLLKPWREHRNLIRPLLAKHTISDLLIFLAACGFETISEAWQEQGIAQQETWQQKTWLESQWSVSREETTLQDSSITKDKLVQPQVKAHGFWLADFLDSGTWSEAGSKPSKEDVYHALEHELSASEGLERIYEVLQSSAMQSRFVGYFSIDSIERWMRGWLQDYVRLKHLWRAFMTFWERADAPGNTTLPFNEVGVMTGNTVESLFKMVLKLPPSKVRGEKAAVCLDVIYQDVFRPQGILIPTITTHVSHPHLRAWLGQQPAEFFQQESAEGQVKREEQARGDDVPLAKAEGSPDDLLRGQESILLDTDTDTDTDTDADTPRLTHAESADQIAQEEKTKKPTLSSESTDVSKKEAKHQALKLETDQASAEFEPIQNTSSEEAEVTEEALAEARLQNAKLQEALTSRRILTSKEKEQEAEQLLSYFMKHATLPVSARYLSWRDFEALFKTWCHSRKRAVQLLHWMRASKHAGTVFKKLRIGLLSHWLKWLWADFSELEAAWLDMCSEAKTVLGTQLDLSVSHELRLQWILEVALSMVPNSGTSTLDPARALQLLFVRLCDTLELEEITLAESLQKAIEEGRMAAHSLLRKWFDWKQNEKSTDEPTAYEEDQAWSKEFKSRVDDTIPVSTQAVADVLAWFLSFGELPWWSPWSSVSSFQEEVAESIKKDGELLREYLQDLLDEETLNLPVSEWLKKLATEPAQEKPTQTVAPAVQWEWLINHINEESPQRIREVKKLKSWTADLNRYLTNWGTHEHSWLALAPITATLRFLHWPEEDRYRKELRKLRHRVSNFSAGTEELAGRLELFQQELAQWEQSSQPWGVEDATANEVSHVRWPHKDTFTRHFSEQVEPDQLDKITWLAARSWLKESTRLQLVDEKVAVDSGNGIQSEKPASASEIALTSALESNQKKPVVTPVSGIKSSGSKVSPARWFLHMMKHYLEARGGASTNSPDPAILKPTEGRSAEETTQDQASLLSPSDKANLAPAARYGEWLGLLEAVSASFGLTDDPTQAFLWFTQLLSDDQRAMDPLVITDAVVQYLAQASGRSAPGVVHFLEEYTLARPSAYASLRFLLKRWKRRNALEKVMPDRWASKLAMVSMVASPEEPFEDQKQAKDSEQSQTEHHIQAQAVERLVHAGMDYHAFAQRVSRDVIYRKAGLDPFLAKIKSQPAPSWTDHERCIQELAKLTELVPAWWRGSYFLAEGSAWWWTIGQASQPLDRIEQLFQWWSRELSMHFDVFLRELLQLTRQHPGHFSQLHAWLQTELKRIQSKASEPAKPENALPSGGGSLGTRVANAQTGQLQDEDDDLIDKLYEVLTEASYDLESLMKEHFTALEQDPDRQDRFFELVKERHEWSEPEAVQDNLYVDNAGLLLLWPFYSRLFSNLGYVADKKFVDAEAREKAIQLLQYLAYKETGHPEHRLSLNKLICGLPLEAPISRHITLTEKEKVETDNFLKAILGQWKAASNTSPEGFQKSFLQREGILYRKKGNWYLKVQMKTFDVLLKTLPWGLTVANFPWTEELICVEWNY